MKLVRRARKSLVERRMKVCLSELTSNLSKVEMKVHRHLKQKREDRRTSRGQALEPIPQDIIDGWMNEELYEIECRLHREAGIPPPPKLRGMKGAAKKSVGMVLFSDILQAVRHKFAKVGPTTERVSN
ncbi:Hypothetical protein, putative [Bodo saltans]|uniref:Uncharacterized protein n=1 Tax=Bodo saltans TaxID=75058 RepID=A0A0S4JCT2_BODSA|nr:Hypothetical protein, putative [Bodo saltans]|eukprot:CUG87828.1 Hypothetical protein, putative [Bodo saltans]